MKPQGHFAPWLFLALFIAASCLMIWRLEAMSAGGFEGTVLGTLVMPYCSGMGNLIFAFILGRNGGSGADVMVNSLVNNVTNMTLVLGLPAVIWGMKVMPEKNRMPTGSRKKGAGKANELNRLSLLLTLTGGSIFHRRGLGVGSQRQNRQQRRIGADRAFSFLAVLPRL